MWTGIPLKKLDSEDKERLKKIESALSLDVIGQGEAINSLSKAVRRARTGLKDPKRPIGAFFISRSYRRWKNSSCKKTC